MSSKMLENTKKGGERWGTKIGISYEVVSHEIGLLSNISSATDLADRLGKFSFLID